jgi:hypothetical protein
MNIIHCISPSSVIRIPLLTALQSPLFIDACRDFLGHGIFVSNGPAWYTQRKISTKIFKKDEFESTFTSYGCYRCVHDVTRTGCLWTTAIPCKRS